MKRRRRLITGGVAAFGCLLLARASWGQAIPNCNDATMFPNPIYLSGSSAFAPTASAMAVKLSALASPVTLIYSATSSCDGPTNILGNKTLTGSASYYAVNPTDATKIDTKSCSLDAGGAAIKADVGISDVFWDNCPGIDAKPATIGDFQGPVQAMILIVPEANTTFTAMSAEQAQDIWGCGMKGMITPFTDDLGIMQRNGNSGTQGVVAKAINVPPDAFKGVTNATGGALTSALLAYLDPQKAIGFLAADAYDTKRTTLNAVAFRAFKQTKAYYADSAADAFDKRNVRDGHYVVWGPEHFFANVGSDGKATNPGAAKFIGLVNGTETTTAFDYIDLEGKAGVVPQCAMKVTRTTDGGNLKPNMVADPCGCFFESVVTKVAAPPGCLACTDDLGCSGGKKCHHNFCE